ncbi:NUDIX domain protein [Collimonas arenae]|nr:NUDIX domain protein [Collimonas arenae]
MLIEEATSDGIRINQPAGHLDPNESLVQAVVRETLEEAAYDFTPTALVGMYMARYVSARTGEAVTYLRFASAAISAGSTTSRWIMASCARCGCHATNWRHVPSGIAARKCCYVLMITCAASAHRWRCSIRIPALVE